MGRPIGSRAGRSVDARGVDHHVAEIAASSHAFERRPDAFAQLGLGQTAAQCQAQIRLAVGQGIEHRRGDRQMPETVAGDVDEKVQLSGS